MSILEGEHKIALAGTFGGRKQLFDCSGGQMFAMSHVRLLCIMRQKPLATVWNRGTREGFEAVLQRCGKGLYKEFQTPPFPAFLQHVQACPDGAMSKEATRKIRYAHEAHGPLWGYRVQSKDKSP